MQVRFTARHYKSPDRLKEYAEKKVQKLEKYYDGIINCEVILDYEKLLQVAEINLDVYNQRLVAIEKSEDVYKSIDLAVDKLKRQLKRYKEKLKDHSNTKPSILINRTVTGE